MIAATHVESLRLEGRTHHGIDEDPKAGEKEEELEAAVRGLDGPRRLYLDRINTLVVLAALRGQTKPRWSLVELQMETMLEPIEVEFFEGFAPTLQKLHLSSCRDEDENPPTLPVFSVAFPLLTHLTVDDFLPNLIASTSYLPSLCSLHLSIVLAHSPPSDSILTAQLPRLLRQLPSLRHLYLDITPRRTEDEATCFDPTVSAFLLDLCAQHGIELVSPRLFLAFGEERGDMSWLDLQGRVVLGERALHVAAKASAIEQLGKHLVAAAGRARATQDGQVVAELQDLLLPLHQRLLVETAEDGMVRPGQ